jgi:hypothetical protein
MKIEKGEMSALSLPAFGEGRGGEGGVFLPRGSAGHRAKNPTPPSPKTGREKARS